MLAPIGLYHLVIMSALRYVAACLHIYGFAIGGRRRTSRDALGARFMIMRLLPEFVLALDQLEQITMVNRPSLVTLLEES